ncbi:MAG: NPCBM/NEW2 domain-containing protein, partial [Thermoguttaceae bacterium]|nr:NPCBM/NEW2 domain-containing protein [Thermoguttaceae bacterium]
MVVYVFHRTGGMPHFPHGRCQRDGTDSIGSFGSEDRRALQVAIGGMLARFLAFAAMVAGFADISAAGDPPVEYLADVLSQRGVSVVTGWGELGLNTAVKPADRPASPLRIKDTTYQRGLGHHANGEIVIDLEGQYQTFEAEIGVQWQGGQNVASTVFQVFVDGQKRFDSGVVREIDPPRKIRVPVEGASELRLVAGDAGDGITCDCANWAEARLVRHPSPPQPASPPATVDIAAFARVMAWDPRRTEGTKAGRVEEFPADDVFLGSELPAGPEGQFTVPRFAGGLGCLGLQWDESRYLREVALELADSADTRADTIQVQYWTGESPWQGTWKPLASPGAARDGRLTWTLSYRDIPRGTNKVRWVFPPAGKPVVVKMLSARTRSSWATATIRLEARAPATPRAEIGVYNGVLVAPPPGATARSCAWQTSTPLVLTVRHSVPRPYKGDRTVLRLAFPQTAFGVAIEDVLAGDGVYVPHAGVFVTREPAPVALDEYLRRIADRKTVLQQVRTSPDQTFERAMAAVHNPVQDLGPVMLSLACDNRKFVVEREGVVRFDLPGAPDAPPKDIPNHARLVPQFGSGTSRRITRALHGGWLPMPVTTVVDRGVVYRQRTFVAPCGETDTPKRLGAPVDAACVVEFRIENPQSNAAEAVIRLALARDQAAPPGLRGSLRELLDLRVEGDPGPLAVRPEGDGFVISGTLAPRGVARVWVAIPASKPAARDAARRLSIDQLADRAERHWRAVMEPAIEVELPDRFLTNVIRASQVHCLLAARNEDQGARIAPWISSDRYGPLESEANSIVRGMGLWGHDDFAQRGLDYFIRRYNPAGFLTTGYTMVGTGWHLWTLAEHFDRTQDTAWARRIAPEVARVCRWIVRQRAKTKRLDSRGQPVPEYGLMPPGVTADWNRYSYRFFNDAQYCTGLAAAARFLAAVGHPEAERFAAEARQYREDLVRAYRWTQARSPVVRLANGAWVPYAPSMLDAFGNVEDFFPGEDWNRSWAGSVEIGAHHLAANGILDPAAQETSWMLDYLEDHQFLRSGMGDYPEEKNRRDPFCLGGFAKVQPYYGRTAEIFAARDEVKP